MEKPLPLFIFQIILLFLLTQSLPATSSHCPKPVTFSVTEFGATGDGVHYDTVSIQSAIDSCPFSIPCRVTFPAPGKYLTATVFLRSGVVLNVETGATIFGGPKLEDYPKESSRWYVVLAENATDVGIEGGGVVDGQAEKFVVRYNERKNVMVSWNETGSCLGDECRPRLIGFLGCKNVKVFNITLNQPAYWWYVFHIFYSSISSLKRFTTV
jgi:polygalacturonase